ncbi:MAG TPA: DUF58 domain-containing protein [Dokdonella sp.]|uniref:DUF58 domain-containing protein n=1 Tax=Dokdonella sp. TaxID=2291710 RepID=UPI002C42A23B|nr:DUF58 domain-containing protein [Dokdonella sp.]HUD41532.1 DUF58 domain-containing protein [Dokdonella sp.]
MSAAARTADPATDQTALAYALRWRVRSLRPGAHRGADTGPTGAFRRLVPFERSPDARRLDLRASLRDPFGGLYVRQFEQRSAASVQVLIDTSASTAFDAGHGSALSRAIALTRQIAAAVRTYGDALGLVAGAASARAERPPLRESADAVIEALQRLAPQGRGIDALLDAARTLGTRRRLVFVLSDFAFAPATLATLLEALAAHDVVPVRFGHEAWTQLPRYGLAELADLETGRRRLVWIRPGLRARWHAAEAAHREAVAALCRRHGQPLLDLPSALDVEAVSRHLLER